MVIFTSWYPTMLFVLYYITTVVFEEVQNYLSIEPVGANPVKKSLMY